MAEPYVSRKKEKKEPDHAPHSREEKQPGVRTAAKLTREDCLVLLREKHALLQQKEPDRYPRRSDFSEREVVAIKAFLGPWPRALEAAGIKPPRKDDRLQKNREKRIRAKQRKRQALRAANSASDIAVAPCCPEQTNSPDAGT